MLTQRDEREKQSGKHVAFRILGPVEAHSEGIVLRLDGEKQITTLAALLIEHGRVVSDSSLIHLLWGEKPPRTADAQLYTYVSRLRRQLSAAVTFHRIGSGYCMELNNASLDYDQFCLLSEIGASELRSGDYKAAAGHLRDALELWRGLPLSNVTVFFSGLYRSSLEQCRMNALENRIEADLALGRHAEVLGELHALIARYPLHEMFRDQLMRALSRCGRKGDAIRVYHEVRHLLAEELGVDPDARLQRTFEAVIRAKNGAYRQDACGRDHMSDRTEIIDVVNGIFAAVDAKEWDTAQAYLETTVKVDYTSLNGGEPETMSSAELVNGWRKGLHDGQDKTFHLFGNYRITVDEDADGDTAAAAFKGYAFTLHAPEFGGHLWEIWGDYEMLLRRTPAGWRANSISVFASVTRSGPKAAGPA